MPRKSKKDVAKEEKKPHPVDDSAPPTSAYARLSAYVDDGADALKVYRTAGDTKRRSGWVFDVNPEDALRIEEVIAAHPDGGPGTFHVCAVSLSGRGSAMGWVTVHVNVDNRPPQSRGQWAGASSFVGGQAQGGGSMSPYDVERIVSDRMAQQGPMAMMMPMMMKMFDHMMTGSREGAQRDAELLREGYRLRSDLATELSSETWGVELVKQVGELTRTLVDKVGGSQDKKEKLAQAVKQSLTPGKRVNDDDTGRRLGDALVPMILGSWKPQDVLDELAARFSPEQVTSWAQNLDAAVESACDSEAFADVWREDEPRGLAFIDRLVQHIQGLLSDLEEAQKTSGSAREPDEVQPGASD